MTQHPIRRGLAALLLAAFALSAAMPADVLGKKDGNGKGFTLVKGGKDKTHGSGNGRGKSGGWSSDKGGKPDHAGGNGSGGGKGRGKWAGDWNAEELIAAGYGAAALYEVLGGDRAVLRTGAKPLPPGIRKNLARGKPLPPGIAKRHAGPQLTDVLPRVSGHEWLEVGRDLVLVTAGTLIVKEILKDVLGS